MPRVMAMTAKEKCQDSRNPGANIHAAFPPRRQQITAGVIFHNAEDYPTDASVNDSGAYAAPVGGRIEIKEILHNRTNV